MSDAEHLIENVILGMKRGEEPKDILNKERNKEMLASSGISAEAMIRMACHVVFALYDGQYPTEDDEDDYQTVIEKAYQKGFNDASERQVENANEARELTIDEWYNWKKNPNHDPICVLWEHDYTPMWILDANSVHEPALLMGKCKLFTGKLTSEQCMNIKWKE